METNNKLTKVRYRLLKSLKNELYKTECYACLFLVAVKKPVFYKQIIFRQSDVPLTSLNPWDGLNNDLFLGLGLFAPTMQNF